MAKYTERLVSRIEKLIETDNYTVTEICRALRLGRSTFYEWKENNPGFRRRILQAEERRDEELLKIARASLKKKLEGYTVLEERCYYEPAKSNPSVMVLKKKVVKTKDKDPDLRAIKYILDREEVKKEKEKAQGGQIRPNIIHVPDRHTAEGLLLLEKRLRGTEGELFRIAETPSPGLDLIPAPSNGRGSCEATKKRE